MKTQQKVNTELLQHKTTLTTFDKALIAAKIIPRSAMHATVTVEDATDVDMLAQRSTPPRNKRDGALSSSAVPSPDVGPRKKRPGSADADWYMALQPAVGTKAGELWPDALMDDLLVD